MIHDQDDDSADNGDEHAPKIEAGDPRLAELLKKPTADHTSDDPEQDVEEEALPPALYDLALRSVRERSSRGLNLAAF